MNIIFIDNLGIPKQIETKCKTLTDFLGYEIDTYEIGKYLFNIVKISTGIPIKLKFSDNLINFSVYVVKTNKTTNKILNIKIEEVIDTNFLKLQTTNEDYESDCLSDIEFDICDKLKDNVC